MAVIEKQDFQFRNYCNLRVFEPKENVTSPVNLVTTCRKYGLIFVAGPSFLQGILMSGLKDKAKDSKPKDVTDEYLNRTISVSYNPTHLDVTCNEQLLVVVGTYDNRSVLYLYKITAFLTAQDVTASTEVSVTSTPGVLVTELSCNPGVPTQIAICTSDECVFVYTFKENGAFEIFTLPPEAHSTCLSWSPKGKQIVVGSTNGNLTQYKPELKAVKCIPLSETVLGSPSSVVAVKWLSNFQFVAVHEKHNKSGSCVVLVNAPKNGPVTYTNFDDLCFSNSSDRKTQYYLHHQQTWNIVLVASGTGSEIAIIGMNPDGVSWSQWLCDDGYRPQLPYDVNGSETYPLGLSVDYSSQIEIPNGDSVIPPMPIFCSLSTGGVLYASFIVNLEKDAPSIIVAPAISSPIMFQYFTKTSAKQRNAIHQHAISKDNTMSMPNTTTPVISLITNKEQVKPIQAPVIPVTGNIATKPEQLLTIKQQLPAANIGSQTQMGTLQPSVPLQLIATQPSIPSQLTSTQPTVPTHLMTTQPTASQLAEEEELKAKQIDKVILKAISSQVKSFENDLKDIKTLISSVRYQIGNDKEKKELVNDVAKIEDFCKELNETTNSLKSDVTQVKNMLLENFVWIEEIKSRLKLIVNGRCWSQVDKLDKVSEGIVKDIQSNIYRVEDDINRLNDVLDDAWLEFQQSVKEIPGRMKVPVMECIYKTIKAQREIINRQEATLNDMYTKLIQAGKYKKEQKLTAAFSTLQLSNKQNVTKSELSRLAENVLKMKLGSKDTLRSTTDTIVNKCLKLNAERYKLSKDKQLKLQEMHNYHMVTRIKPTKRINAKKIIQLDSSLILPCNVTSIDKTDQKHVHTNTTVDNASIISQSSTTDSQLTALLLKLINESSVGKEILDTVKQQLDDWDKCKKVLETPMKTNYSKQEVSKILPTTPVGRSTPKSFPKSINPIGQPISFNKITEPRLGEVAKKEVVKLGVKQKLSMESDYGEYSDSDSDDKVSVISQPLCDSPQDLSIPDKDNSFTFSLTSLGKADVPKSSLTTAIAPKDVVITSAPLFKTTVPSSISMGQSSLYGLLNTRTTPSFSTPTQSVFGTQLQENVTPKVGTTTTVAMIPETQTFFGAPICATTKMPVSVTSNPSSVAKSNTFSFSSYTVPTVNTSNTISASPLSSPSTTVTTSHSIFGTPASTQASLFSSLTIGQSSLFGTVTTTTQASIFGAPLVATTASSQSPIAASLTVTSAESSQSSIFGSPVVTSAEASKPSIFGDVAVTSSATTKPQLFGSTAVTITTDTQSSLFGSPLGLNTVATQSSMFGGSIPNTPSVAQSSIFGTATSAATTSIFGSPTVSTATVTSQSSICGISNATNSIFDSQSALVSTQPSIFGANPSFSTTTSSMFGASTTTSSIFGSPTTTSSTFGSPTTTSSIFGTPATTSSIFGTPATTSSSIFGTPTTTSSSIFGTPATSSSIFGSSSTSSSIFGTVTTSTSSSIFGTPSVTTTSIFGQPTTSASGFGQPAFGNTSTIFGQPKAADTQGSIFGSKPTFGSPSTAFQVAGTSAFGSGSFSSGGNSVATGGFGTPAVFQKPLFGSGATFGASPTIGRQSAFGSPSGFGSPPSFGSPNKVFGQTTQSGFGAPVQASPFGNIANENTVSFGNLAAQQTPAFASQPAFGASQQQNTFSSPTFGGSSFSSWR